ncbi:MAG TPA: hypothetical protein PKZ83_17660 [bacterium]|nr:hypothetical protein [bacterium]
MGQIDYGKLRNRDCLYLHSLAILKGEKPKRHAAGIWRAILGGIYHHLYEIGWAIVQVTIWALSLAGIIFALWVLSEATR